MYTGKSVWTDEDSDGDVLEILAELRGSKRPTKKVSARKKKKKLKKKKKDTVSSEQNSGESIESRYSESDSSDGAFIKNMSKNRHSKDLRQWGRAELSNVTVSLKHLPLRLNIYDENRVSAVNILQCVTVSESVSHYVVKYPTFALPKNYRNKMNAIAWTRMIYFVISEEFWAI